MAMEEYNINDDYRITIIDDNADIKTINRYNKINLCRQSYNIK